MVNDGYAMKLRAMMIRQQDLADRLGVRHGSVAKALATGNSRYEAIIDALEIMTPPQRAEWLKNTRGKESEND